jgi:hypothetical protein
MSKCFGCSAVQYCSMKLFRLVRRTGGPSQRREVQIHPHDAASGMYCTSRPTAGCIPSKAVFSDTSPPTELGPTIPPHLISGSPMYVRHNISFLMGDEGQDGLNKPL